jgi:NADPH-dependent 2,4-dienoyl-CoA reductase/sulfur reductase-like enzyme
VSGDVPDWHNLAHRGRSDLEAAGLRLRTRTRATAIAAPDHSVKMLGADGRTELLTYDALVIGTGAVSVVPPIAGLTGPGALGPADGVHTLHTMGDVHAVMDTLHRRDATTAVVIGAGYIGLEMAEALTARGCAVTQIEALPEVLPTLDPELGQLVRAQLTAHGIEVLTATTVSSITRAPVSDPALVVRAQGADGSSVTRTVDIVLVVVGVRPDSGLAESAGARLGVKGAVQVDTRMATNLPDVYAAGDCAITHHRLLGETWLPLGTTAHKQGRVAAENALGGDKRFQGSLGTQVVEVFDLVAARTGLRDHDAAVAGQSWAALTVASRADDHKAYYPGATTIDLRVTGDTASGLLMGAQLVGRHGAEIAKRVDVFAAALFTTMPVDAFNDLDLSYTPPLGSPWCQGPLSSARRRS